MICVLIEIAIKRLKKKTLDDEPSNIAGSVLKAIVSVMVDLNDFVSFKE